MSIASSWTRSWAEYRPWTPPYSWFMFRKQLVSGQNRLLVYPNFWTLAELYNWQSALLPCYLQQRGHVFVSVRPSVYLSISRITREVFRWFSWKLVILWAIVIRYDTPIVLCTQKLTVSQLSLAHITKKTEKITNTRTKNRKKPMSRGNQKQVRESMRASPVWYHTSCDGQDLCMKKIGFESLVKNGWGGGWR